MADSRNKPELETLDYKPICSRCQKASCQCRAVLLKESAKCSPALMGFNSAVIKPETRVNKTEDAEQTFEPLKFPELDTSTIRIVNACKQVLWSFEDHENDTMTTPITLVDACERLNCVINKIRNSGGYDVADLYEPNQNLMIIEQAEGATKVILELLGQITPYNTDQRGDVQGCIWTLDGWLENNLKHLKGAFE